jgi:hypothetical protein
LAAPVPIEQTSIPGDSDWAEIFHDYTEGVPIEDVVEVLGFEDGENEGAQWVGLFKLRDGRFMFTEAGCDYTGWSCRADGKSKFYNTAREAILDLGVEYVGTLGLEQEWADILNPPQPPPPRRKISRVADE